MAFLTSSFDFRSPLCAACLCTYSTTLMEWWRNSAVCISGERQISCFFGGLSIRFGRRLHSFIIMWMMRWFSLASYCAIYSIGFTTHSISLTRTLLLQLLFESNLSTYGQHMQFVISPCLIICVIVSPNPNKSVAYCSWDFRVFVFAFLSESYLYGLKYAIFFYFGFYYYSHGYCVLYSTYSGLSRARGNRIKRNGLG